MPHLRVVCEGMVRWGFADRGDRVEHGDVCRIAHLDPHTHRLDLASTGEGYIFRDGVDKPIGTVTIARQGMRFRELDPLDPRDRLTLRQYTSDR